DADGQPEAGREPKGCQGEKGACNLADRPEEFGVEHWCAPKFALTRERRGPLCPPEKGREAEASLSFLHREETPREGQALNAPIRWLRKGGCRERLGKEFLSRLATPTP